MEEKGYVMVVTLLVLLLLSVIGIAATRTSNVELQLSVNTKKMVEDFYVTEGALMTTLEHTDWWLDDDFFAGGEGSGYWRGHVDIDGDHIHDAYVEICCVTLNSGVNPALSAAANRIPADRHIGPPPIGSGYSARHFITRKYAVTARDLRSGIDLQAGVWKIFNKY
jgi:hypothetical protein